jgi:hypothetical protein
VRAGILADLEELSLHQLYIEKIEILSNLCNKLRILYLQNNLIPKIGTHPRHRGCLFVLMSRLQRISSV